MRFLEVLPELQTKVGELVPAVDAQYRGLGVAVITDSEEGKLKRRLLDLLSTSVESLIEVHGICTEALELRSSGSDLSELVESIGGEGDGL